MSKIRQRVVDEVEPLTTVPPTNDATNRNNNNNNNNINVNNTNTAAAATATAPVNNTSSPRQKSDAPSAETLTDCVRMLASNNDKHGGLSNEAIVWQIDPDLTFERRHIEILGDFDTTAVDQIRQLAAGKSVVIVSGESGSGKTNAGLQLADIGKSHFVVYLKASRLFGDGVPEPTAQQDLNDWKNNKRDPFVRRHIEGGLKRVHAPQCRAISLAFQTFRDHA